MKWSDQVNWGAIPDYMREGVTLYVVHGITPGHFLTAVFKNDFMEMARRADDANGRAFMEYAKLLYNECPAGCFGSESNYKAWTARGGLKGNDKHEPLPLHEWGRFADQDR